MARSVEEINTKLDEAQAAETELSVFNSTSQTSIFEKFKYVIAFCQNILEQLFDAHKVDVETQIASAAVGSDAWVQKKMFEFQYSATTPQVLQLNNYAPAYNPIDTTLQIITRCSVKTGSNKTVYVKVAKNDPPEALSAPQITAAQGYLNNTGSNTTNGRGIGFAGVQYNLISLEADKVMISGDLNYDGQYASTIVASVIAAINDYLANIDFDGLFNINKLINYIQAVPGVLDFTPEDIGIRADAVAFPGYVYVCQAYTIIYPSYPLVAGYAIGETQLGYEIGDNITFTSN